VLGITKNCLQKSKGVYIMKKYKITYQILNGVYEEVKELNEREVKKLKDNWNYTLEEIKN
jgi:hypothetical protein